MYFVINQCKTLSQSLAVREGPLNTTVTDEGTIHHNPWWRGKLTIYDCTAQSMPYKARGQSRGPKHCMCYIYILLDTLLTLSGNWSLHLVRDDDYEEIEGPSQSVRDFDNICRWFYVKSLIKRVPPSPSGRSLLTDWEGPLTRMLPDALGGFQIPCRY